MALGGLQRAQQVTGAGVQQLEIESEREREVFLDKAYVRVSPYAGGALPDLCDLRIELLNGDGGALPGAFYASLAGVEKAEYFEVGEEARAVPEVDFSEKSDG